MIQITPHFTLEEATTTSTGLPNVPSQSQLDRIANTALNMEIVRAILGRKPIIVSSWFRSTVVNTKVGGAPNSEHLLGAAVDFTCPAYGSVLEVCRALISLAHVANYNQLILENGWIHISFPLDGLPGKKEVLTFKNRSYLPGLVL